MALSSGRIGMRRLGLALVVLLAFGAVTEAAAQTTRKRLPKQTEDARSFVIERVAAVVNDKVILESEVVRRARPMLMGLEEEDPATRARTIRSVVRRTLEEMITEELMVIAADEAQLEVKTEEVDRSLDEVKRKNALTDAQFAAALKEQGYTLPQYREELERQIIRFRAVNTLVRPRVSVTDQDIRRRYESMAGQAQGTSAVHIAHILLRPTETVTPDQVNALAADVVARARAGESFDELAAAHSQDEGTRESGGDLGWFERGELPTEWENILFGMDEGEVRGPIRGPRGVHVFKVTEVRSDDTRPFEEAKAEIEEELYQEGLEKQAKVWVEELRKQAHVDIKL